MWFELFLPLMAAVLGLVLLFDGGDALPPDDDNRANADQVITGTPGNDELWGDPTSDDWISLGNGDDQSFGLSGDDTIYGGPGQDRLQGDDGNDLINGGNDADNLSGGAGDDTLLGGGGNDRLGASGDYEAGNDRLEGGSGWDYLVDQAGSNYLSGGPGNDQIIATEDAAQTGPDTGDDTLIGGDGDDLLMGDYSDTMTGGDGADRFGIVTEAIGTVVITDFDPDSDTLLLSLGDTFAPSASPETLGLQDSADGTALELTLADRVIARLEGLDETATIDMEVRFSGQDDDLNLILDASVSQISTGAGDDSVTGSAAANEIASGRGDDTINGGAGDDGLLAGSGNDQANGGSGDDVISLGRGNDAADGGDGNDTIYTGTEDPFYSFSGTDTIDAGPGDDVIVVDETDGGPPSGGHMLTGGDGDDSYIFRYAQDDNATITDFDAATESLAFQIALPQSVIDLGPVTYALVDNGAGGSIVVLTMPDGAAVSPVTLAGVPPTATLDLTVQVSAA